MQIIPIASGKGGVGKSLISANLAIALGKAGKKVILADFDLGASNLHLVIGQQAPKAGLGTFLTGQSKFEDIILQTEYENVSFIPGDSEIPGLSLLKSEQKSQIIKKFQQFDADYLIIDLGAGTHLNILDFFQIQEYPTLRDYRHIAQCRTSKHPKHRRRVRLFPFVSPLPLRVPNSGY